MSKTAVRITIDCLWNILRYPSQTDRQTDRLINATTLSSDYEVIALWQDINLYIIIIITIITQNDIISDDGAAIIRRRCYGAH